MWTKCFKKQNENSAFKGKDSVRIKIVINNIIENNPSQVQKHTRLKM